MPPGSAPESATTDLEAVPADRRKKKDTELRIKHH